MPLLGRTEMSCTLLGFLVLCSSLSGAAEEYQWSKIDASAKRQEQRQENIKVEAFIDSLGVTPDMNIVDIGAGAGYVSFLFADKIKGGTGKVFATDVLADRIAWIAAEAKKRGVSNVIYSQVKAEGLDDFYRKNRYDIAYVSNAYHAIENQVGYFTELRKTLKPGGRLVIVMYDQEPVYLPEDIKDPDGLARSILADAAESPFYRAFSDNTKSLLAETPLNKESFVEAAIGDFNRLLREPDFFRGFIIKGNFRNQFSVQERAFADWLVMDLKDEGAFGIELSRWTPRTQRKLARLNRLLISKAFGGYLENGGAGNYLPTSDVNRYTSKFAAIRELRLAGYRLSQEQKLSPHFDGLIFIAEPGQGSN